MKKKEESLQIAVCRYIAHKYPDVIFSCDLASGMKLTIGQAVKAKKMRSSRAYPDLFIAEPRGGYAGLYLELKTVSPWKKTGGLKKDKHLEEQSEMLDRLWLKGYMAVFAVGIDEAIKIIDNYMKKS